MKAFVFHTPLRAEIVFNVLRQSQPFFLTLGFQRYLVASLSNRIVQEQRIVSFFCSKVKLNPRASFFSTFFCLVLFALPGSTCPLCQGKDGHSALAMAANCSTLRGSSAIILSQ